MKLPPLLKGEWMDYNINFPNLHIYLEHVGKTIMIGNFPIAYYGIIIALGMLAGIGIACWMAKKTGQNPDTYFDLAILAIVCSVIGARIYFVAKSLKSHHLNDEGEDNEGNLSFLAHKI